ncbi:hypothetical protein JKP88DRAFT_248303 [Tribonema minus]|uniref:Uncharacterized protein n=1 Tax=Tribonema minus TaxID=303371 RepID=A0A835YRA6_9STRA|nr:hypothetical protein JKP88DRAFT_248303 [Tribonema minus]
MRTLIAIAVCALVMFLLYKFMRDDTESQPEPPITKCITPVKTPPAREEPPNEVLLLQNCSRKLAHGDWNAMVEAADIYARGAFPRYCPSVALALTMYALAAASADAEVAGQAQSQFVSTRLHPVAGVDVMGPPLPACYGERMCAAARDMNRADTYCRRRPVPPPSPVVAVREAPVVGEAQVVPIPAVRELPAAAAPPRPPPPRVPIPTAARARRNGRPRRRAAERPCIRLDTQNVHDHSVIAASKSNLARLVAEHGDIELMPDVFVQICDLAEGNADALSVLKVLSMDEHSTVGVSERQALAHVWTKIIAIRDDTIRENVKGTLILRLGECVEHSLPVCSTGRMVRMLSTLDGASDDVKRIKPMWAVRDEIGNLAVQVRQSTLDDATKDEVAAYESGTSTRLSDVMKAGFTARAVATYVDELGMDAGVLQSVLSPFTESF